MEKNNDLAAPRAPRSMQAVLHDGYRLFAQNFVRLVRSSWIQAIVYALTVGATATCFFLYLLPAVLSDGRSWFVQLAVWLGLMLVFVLAALLLAFAGGVAPLHDHFLTGTIRSPRRWWGRWPWRLMLRGLTTLPRMLWQTVRRGQLGTLVVVSVVMLLGVLVATVVLELPALILATADIQAQAGLAAGDAVDLPDNMLWINFATFSCCGLLQAYIHLATLFPLYYVWRNTQPTTPHTAHPSES